MKKRNVALITGITGQDGSYLAEFLLSKGYDVHGITREDVANKLFKELAPSYAERNGGYTRIIRTGIRRGDAAETAIIELVK